MKYGISLKTVVFIEIEADSIEDAIEKAKEQAAWDYFNNPEDWELYTD